MAGRTLALGLLAVAGCGTTTEPAPTPEPAAAQVEPTPAPQEEEPPPERLAKVVERIDSGTYTYARMDACGNEAWVAGPKSDMAVGDVVAMPAGMGMTDFESPTLGRTFEAILFVDWFRKESADALDCAKVAAASAPSEEAASPNHSTDEKPPPPIKFHGKVLETMRSGGYAYVRIDNCGTERWMAGPPIPLEKGQHVVVRDGYEMTNFPAKSLDRTFDSIWFVTTFGIATKPPKCG